jgi:hypothetical protein
MHFEKQTLKFCHVSATLKIILIQAFYPEFSGIEARTETFEECSILFKFKEGESATELWRINHPVRSSGPTGQARIHLVF